MSSPGRFLIMSAIAALLVKWASVINPSLHGADSFETTVVVCIVIICGVIALYFWSKKAAKETKEKNQEQLRFIKTSVHPKNFTLTRQFNDWHFDDTHQKICVIKHGTTQSTTFAFSQIKDIQVISEHQSNQSGNPVTRAVVGGVLTGGIGAIVGASSALKQTDYCSKLGIHVILFNDQSLDAYFLTSPAKRSSMTYQSAYSGFVQLYNALSEAFDKGHPELHNIDLTSQ